MERQARPRVGVGVMLLREGRILLGRRLTGHGAGSYGWCGGHLELGEAPEACAVRETLEETGLMLDATDLVPQSVCNVIAYGTHYVDFAYLATRWRGTPTVREPGKVAGWEWHPLDALPEPLFAPVAAALACRVRGAWLGAVRF